ncbi:MAG: hypothetical protein KDE20_18455, partial [Caldilineaceae bacterium]|nr:hypothetical protein [Caldilineaceae bacterium]
EGRLGPRYPAPYASFVRLHREATQADAAPPAPVKTPAPATVTVDAPARPRKLSWKEQQELKSLESAIATLEARRDELAQAMAAAGGDYVKLTELAAAAETLEAELDTKLLRWMELQEIAEAAA